MHTFVAAIAVLLIHMASPDSAWPGTDSPGIEGAAVPTAARSPVAPANKAGPAKWDAAGRVKCSIGNETFTRTCGFRLVRNQPEEAADIWIRNLAKNKAEYRFLHYANETFASDDGSKVTWTRKAKGWSVQVDGKEFYLVPDRLIHGR